VKIHDVEQGSDAWLRLRMGKVTASELGNLISPTWEIRTGDMPKSYLAAKVGEAFEGTPDIEGGSWETEQGQLMEMESRKWYAFSSGDRVKQVGFIEGDDGRCGCSPDGLIGEDGGLELKCPQRKAHTGYILNGVLPKEYAVQVHANMYVTGRKWWRFVSYRRKSKFVLTVERDEEKCAIIAKALAAFYKRYDEAMHKQREAA
jgi:hypothetical protein